ncbi:type I-MYXAN CRISPR-associated endonuclease Cas4/Cas1 [Brevibacillus borstelensis]|uniref:type I-MYXAN CRISPR-associated endonuclease Cas4/Cas1 n=1 Tax=Brevibacillus borstelensis TaxID=45462 RepID=UPI000A7B7D63|nr:type I-MYXAN CRISPR-associated endonuclease Cas1 [Brevibacillus borstelensis]
MSAAADQPLTRIMALHALEYCERLFFLEEVEEIRLADQAVYDGRRLHEEMPKYIELTNFTLESPTLGIRGKVDCIRSVDGNWIPYEYKKGHAKKSSSRGIYEAWPSDEIQVAAYAMLLEEHFGQRIPEGKVYYASDHRTVSVPVDEQMRSRVRQAISRAEALRASTERPHITTNERLCARCSLAPVCLPEEERLLDSPKREVIRLFPEDREKLDLHVASHGAYIRRSGLSLVVEQRDGEKEVFPSEQINSLSIHGQSVQLSTQALMLCAEKGIAVHWLTGGGNYIGSVTKAAGGVQRRLRQYKALTDDAVKLALAKKLVLAKMESQLRYVLRCTRGKPRSNTVVTAVEAIRHAVSHSQKVKTTEELLGWEGSAAKAYFACFAEFTADELEAGMAFSHRNRRPPKDPANALLSFYYGMLYKDCVEAITVVGLDPTIGFYHQPRSQAYPLALDLMEIFRVSLCDITAMGTIHRKQWDVEEDFTKAGDQVWLSEAGKKKAIAAYERRKQDTWKHPVIGYSLSYDRAIELEVRLLEKEWSGRPGLFAQSRLR